MGLNDCCRRSSVVVFFFGHCFLFGCLRELVLHNETKHMRHQTQCAYCAKRQKRISATLKQYRTHQASSKRQSNVLITICENFQQKKNYQKTFHNHYLVVAIQNIIFFSDTRLVRIQHEWIENFRSFSEIATRQISIQTPFQWDFFTRTNYQIKKMF